MRLPIVLSLVATIAGRSWAQYDQTAHVYFWPSSDQPTAGLHPIEAISHHLGFEVHDSLGDRTKEQWDSLKTWKSTTGSVGAGAEDSVLVVVQSDHPEDFIPLDMKRTYSIPNPPPVEIFTDMIHAFTERAHRLFDTVYSSLEAATRDADGPAYKAILDIFDVASRSAATFVREFEDLARFVDSDQSSSASSSDNAAFSAFEVNGLAELEKDDGRHTIQYRTAAQGIQAVLSNPSMRRRRIAVIVVPPAETRARQKRALAEGGGAQEPFSSPPSNKVVFSISTCFASNETCTEKTQSCSGHGACSSVTRAGKTCYACSCAITKNDRGRRQWWAGQACERKDLSTSFVLLAGTTIFLVVLIGFAVSLIYYIGLESLPNTLTAGAISHGKRD